MTTYDESKLPQWAQSRLNMLRSQEAALEKCLKAAQAKLNSRQVPMPASVLVGNGFVLPFSLVAMIDHHSDTKLTFRLQDGRTFIIENESGVQGTIDKYLLYVRTKEGF